MDEPKLSTLVVESLQVLDIFCEGGISGTRVREAEVEDCTWFVSGTVCGEGWQFGDEEYWGDSEGLFRWTGGEVVAGDIGD